MNRRPSVSTLLLAAVVLLGLGLRLWGIRFGLPHPLCRPDEEFIISKALGFFSGDLNPHFFEWPSLYLYLVHGGLRLVYHAGHITGHFADTHAFVLWVTGAPSWLHLSLRLVSAAASLLTILIVFRMAARVSDRATALVAAFFFAIAFLSVREAHFGLVDSALTLLISGTVRLLLESLDRPRALTLLACAGGLAGAATSMKYNAGALLGVALTTSMLRAWRHGWRPALGGLGLWLLIWGLVAAAGTPYALLDFGTFSHDVSTQVARLSEGHGVRLANGWRHNLFFSLTGGLGAPLLWAGIAGLPLMLVRNWNRALIVWAFPLTYFLAVGGAHTGFVRYSLPLVPFLTVGAAVTLRALGQAVSRFTPPAAYWVTATAAVAVAIPSLMTAVTFDRLITRRDTRLVAEAWLTSQPASGASLYQSGWEYAHPVVSTSQAGEGFRTVTFDGDRGRFTFDGRDTEDPQWLVIARSPLRVYTPVPFELTRVAAERYLLAYRIAATTGPEAESWFDRQDAFFLPYARMEYRSRPGPELEIFRKRD